MAMVDGIIYVMKFSAPRNKTEDANVLQRAWNVDVYIRHEAPSLPPETAQNKYSTRHGMIAILRSVHSHPPRSQVHAANQVCDNIKG